MSQRVSWYTETGGATVYTANATLAPGGACPAWIHTTSSAATTPFPGSVAPNSSVTNIQPSTQAICQNGPYATLTTSGCAPKTLGYSFSGQPAAGQITIYPVLSTQTIPTGCAGGVGGALTASSGTAVFTMIDLAGGVGGAATTVCTFTFSTSVTPTVTGLGSPFQVNAGDFLEWVAPNPQDATLANIGLAAPGVQP